MKPPCKKDGQDCPLRRAGCQVHCEQYKAYREDQDRHNEELKPRREALTVLCHSRRAANSRIFKNRFRR